MRDSIAHLRLNGVPIMSSASAAGYWLARTADEIRDFRDEQWRRAKVILDVNDALKFTEQAKRAREQEGVTEPVAMRLL